MFSLEEYKRVSNKSKNKNFGFVTIKVPHNCGHCKTLLNPGTNCLTANVPKKGRKWYCDECVSLIIKLRDANTRLAMTPIGDIGGSYAAMDLVRELEDELYNRAH